MKCLLKELLDEIHLLAVSENEVELLTNVFLHKTFSEILP